MSAYLSKDYVESASSRMKIYKKVSMIDTSEKLVSFIKDTESVYGDMPEELCNLCKIALIKNMCSHINANKISIKILNFDCIK